MRVKTTPAVVVDVSMTMMSLVLTVHCCIFVLRIRPTVNTGDGAGARSRYRNAQRHERNL